ncbi:MAG: hypothetical protein WC565_02085 [Parcubacteria group bacterium]
MARVLKKPGSVEIPPSPLTPETTGEVRQVLGMMRRRVLKEKEHPAIAQFSDPEAKARVKEALAVNPNLQPTAFSHRPGREGCFLTAIESCRVLSGKSIHIAGFGFAVDDRAGDAMCLKCYLEQGQPSQVPGRGFTIALFESKTVDRVCVYCGTEFKGER